MKGNAMFLVLATKPLNDGTRGFRFNVVGLKGLTRLRKHKKRYGITKGKCTREIHIGKLSVYMGTKVNRDRENKRRFEHFAG